MEENVIEEAEEGKISDQAQDSGSDSKMTVEQEGI